MNRLSIGETIVLALPAFGFLFGLTFLRRGRRSLGGALAGASLLFALVALAMGNARPVGGCVAFGLFVLAFALEAGGRDGLALTSIAAAFLAGGITSAYL